MDNKIELKETLSVNDLKELLKLEKLFPEFVRSVEGIDGFDVEAYDIWFTENGQDYVFTPVPKSYLKQIVKPCPECGALRTNAPDECPICWGLGYVAITKAIDEYLSTILEMNRLILSDLLFDIQYEIELKAHNNKWRTFRFPETGTEILRTASDPDEITTPSIQFEGGKEHAGVVEYIDDYIPHSTLGMWIQNKLKKDVN